MPTMEITHKELECLVKMVETGSFSQAANELNLTQPTLSNHIKKLEKSTGSRLVKRGRNGLTLTNAGEIIYKNALNIIRIFEKMKNEIIDLQGLKTGTIIIAGSTIPGTYILPEKIKEFKSIYKDVLIKLQIKNSTAVIEDIQKGKIDVGIVGYLPPKSLFKKQIAEDEIVVAVNRTHRWFNMHQISLEIFLEEPLLMRESGSGTGKYFMEAIQKKTNKKSRIFSTVGTSEAMKMSIITGPAPGIISKTAIQNELEYGVLNAINIKDISLKRPFYLVLKNFKNASLACKTFIKVFDT